MVIRLADYKIDRFFAVVFDYRIRLMNNFSGDSYV